MTVSAVTTNTESDPVAAALADPIVGGRLLAAARSFLGRRASTLSATQRIAEAEEIVSIARGNAWKKRAQFDPARDVVCWLVGFVNNATRDYCKKSRRELTGSTDAAPALENLVADIGGPLDSLVEDEQREQLARVRSQLSDEEQELLRLKYDEGLTFEEIGERMGANTNAVRVRHHRLTGRLRQLLEAAGEGRP